MVLQVSVIKFSESPIGYTYDPLLLCIGSSDFEPLMPISVMNNAQVRIFTTNDFITLEYDDSIILIFTPDNPALIPTLEGFGEYIRDTAIVNIIDDDSKCSLHCYEQCACLYNHFTGLEINFEETAYTIEEGGTLSADIRLQFRNNQNPFTIILSTVSTEELGFGINIFSDFIQVISRATAGIFSTLLGIHSRYLTLSTCRRMMYLLLKKC